MKTSEEYLKEHNIKSVSMISEKSMDGVLLIKMMDDEVLRVEVPQGSVASPLVYDEMIVNTVYEYELKKKMEERKPKLDKIVQKLKE